MNLKFLFAALILVIPFYFLQGQNLGVNKTGAAGDPSAGVDVNFTDAGFLIPRMTTTQRNAIASPANALLIYNTTAGCFQAYNAAASVWENVYCFTNCIGPPAAPTANAATSVQSTSFTANWTASVGATSYYLDVATDVGFTSFVPGYNNLNVGNVTSYNVTGLTASTTYYYRVRASNACGTSGNSNTITVTTSSSCEATGVTSCLTAWWQMNEGSGITTADASGNGYTANLQGGSSWTTGNLCNGILFNGTNSYLTNSLNPGETLPFTVTAWVRINTTANEKMIVGTCTSAWNGFWFEINGTTIRSYCSNGVCDNNTPTGMTTGIWYHVAMVYTGTQVIHYLNGTAVGTYGCSSTSDSGGTLYIGAIGSYSTINYLFNGTLDDVRWYNCALNGAQITQIYNGN